MLKPTALPRAARIVRANGSVRGFATETEIPVRRYGGLKDQDRICMSNKVNVGGGVVGWLTSSSHQRLCSRRPWYVLGGGPAGTMVALFCARVGLWQLLGRSSGTSTRLLRPPTDGMLPCC